MQVKRVFYVHGWTGRYMLLRNLHFHHPWWSYSARSQEGGAVMSMDGRADMCSSTIAPALFYYLPSMAVCVALISYIRVRMRNLHFHRTLPISISPVILVHRVHRPWWSYSARSQEGGAVMAMDGQIVEIYRLLMQILSIKITIAYDLNSAYYYQYR